MRNARVCYNHLAGDMGVRLYDSLVSQRYLLVRDGSPALSKKGRGFVRDFGIDLEQLQASRATLCRECLDWSERRSHLAGSLGRAFLSHMESLRWLKRGKGRVITFSPEGEKHFINTFKLNSP